MTQAEFRQLEIITIHLERIANALEQISVKINTDPDVTLVSVIEPIADAIDDLGRK